MATLETKSVVFERVDGVLGARGPYVDAQCACAGNHGGETRKERVCRTA